MSSGQGVSRLSYQKGRSLGNRGKADASPAVSTKFSSETKGGGRGYSKSDLPSGINVSYGDTLNPTDLAETKTIFSGKVPTASEYGKQKKTKALKPDKGGSGWK